MTILPDFLRIECNGVEYFTLVATGQSGMSQVGIAKSLGVTPQAISLLVKSIENSVTSKDLPISLQSLHGKVLQLQAKYKNASIFDADTWACFAEYYAFEAKKKTPKALAVYRAFGKIGANSYIQGVTGWLPDQFQSSPAARQNLNRILDEPSPWVRLYEKSFCDRVFNWYGAQFYWQYAYFSLTDREVCKLNELNPAVNGDRDFRIHQYLESETKDRLRAYLVELTRMVDMAPDKQTFEAMYQHYFQRNTQLRLF